LPPESNQETIRLCVRLLDEIDEPLRRKVRYQGDFQRFVIEAIETTDLGSAPLAVIRNPKVRNTTIRVSEELFLRLSVAAAARDTSVNVLVNTAVSCWIRDRG
jgi:hypothetical protein